MRAFLAICAIVLTACAVEADVEVQIDAPKVTTSAAQNEIQNVEVHRELDILLDLLESNVSKRGRVANDESVREYRAILQQIGDAKLSDKQLARLNFLLPENCDKFIQSIDELLNSIRMNAEVRRKNRAWFESANTEHSLKEFRQILQKINNLELFAPRGLMDIQAYHHQHEVLDAQKDAFIRDRSLTCQGVPKKGSVVVCRTKPNIRVEVGRSENDTYIQTADNNGVLLVEFDRDEPAAFVRIGEARVDFDIQKRESDTSCIDGLPKKRHANPRSCGQGCESGE